MVPKQFCSLYEGPSLLQEALGRAHTVAEERHTCAIVAVQHRCWWEGALCSLPVGNVIVQPENRGTANGVLLPLLHIISRDPAARIVVLPSDHHVLQETLLTSSLREALEQLESRFDQTVLLGIEPDNVDSELGYIVPGPTDGRGGALTVTRFVEKPPSELARELIRGGALWNAFIVVSAAQALLKLFRQRVPEIVSGMGGAVQRDRGAGSSGTAISEFYEQLPVVDFSRDILEGQESDLRVLPVPHCGWSDLGTPKRVAEALCRAPQPERARAGRGYLSLADQHRQLVGGQGAAAAT